MLKGERGKAPPLEFPQALTPMAYLSAEQISRAPKSSPMRVNDSVMCLSEPRVSLLPIPMVSLPQAALAQAREKVLNLAQCFTFDCAIFSLAPLIVDLLPCPGFWDYRLWPKPLKCETSTPLTKDINMKTYFSYTLE